MVVIRMPESLRLSNGKLRPTCRGMGARAGFLRRNGCDAHVLVPASFTSGKLRATYLPTGATAAFWGRNGCDAHELVPVSLTRGNLRAAYLPTGATAVFGRRNGCDVHAVGPACFTCSKPCVVASPMPLWLRVTSPTHYPKGRNGWTAWLVAFMLLPHMIRTAWEHETAGHRRGNDGSIPKEVLASRAAMCSSCSGAQSTVHQSSLHASGRFCTLIAHPLRSLYNITKILNIFFVRALNARLGTSTPLIVTAVNPGFCASDLLRDLLSSISWIMALYQRLMTFTTEEGSWQLVFGAVWPGELHGEYINRSRMEELSDFVVGPGGTEDGGSTLSAPLIVSNSNVA
ncbi:hypothetical protein C8J57DRAFT_1517334 [Mycena rebaudengoi]|nr:hypothetical protein C8J57DRAFT_1517334 [Mycena rebaudengoi]